MKTAITTLVLVIITGSLAALPAAAHHGWGGYKDRVELTVTIVELKLGNPHDRLIAADDTGQEWNLLLAPPARNRRFGFSAASVSVGDVVEFLGQKHPRRHEIKVHCLYRGGENLYTYRYDSGQTSLDRQRKGDNC